MKVVFGTPMPEYQAALISNSPRRGLGFWIVKPSNLKLLALFQRRLLYFPLFNGSLRLFFLQKRKSHVIDISDYYFNHCWNNAADSFRNYTSTVFFFSVSTRSSCTLQPCFNWQWTTHQQMSYLLRTASTGAYQTVHARHRTDTVSKMIRFRHSATRAWASSWLE